jgi:fructokinase
VIVVAGENLVDLVADPSGTLTPRLGGGPFTVARALGRLGAEVSFLGTLSDDAFGRALHDALAAEGVGLELTRAVPEPTTLALTELSPRGAATYRFYSEGTAAPQIIAPQVRAAEQAGPVAVHVGTNGLALEPGADMLAGLVAAVGPECLVVLDPNIRPGLVPPAGLPAYRARLARLAARADVIKVSDEDLDWLGGSDWLAGAPQALVLLTRGGDAVEVLLGTERATVAVPKVRVVDTIGAGDSFGAGFLRSWLAQGLPPASLRELGPHGPVLDAVRYGVAVSGITCQRAGADPPTAAEVAGIGFVLPGGHG